MGQPTHLNRNLPDLGGPFLYRDQEPEVEKGPYTLETPYGFLLDLDFLKYVNDIERGQTLRKVPLQRKPKGPKQARGQIGGWTSTESLSSTTSEDGKPAFSPRPKPWAGPSENKDPASKGSPLPTSPSPVIQLLPPPIPKSLSRNARVEKTLLETSRRLELVEQFAFPGNSANLATSKVPTFPQDSSSSLPLTGEPQPDPALLPPAKLSPSNSGKSTPATAVSPLYLHHVRDQMAAALKQLKDLEDQVKVIPVLEQQISKLKTEKEQLVARLWENLEPEEGETCVFHFPPSALPEAAPANPEDGSAEGPAKGRPSKIAELKKLTEKLSSSERAGKTPRAAPRASKAEPRPCRSVGVGEETDMKEAVFYYRCQKPCRDVGVGREAESRDAEVWVMESWLGVSSEAEKEIQLLQETVQHQKDVISMLEGHLKEATNELEELRVEVCLRIPKNVNSQETMARPEMAEAGTEAAPATRCQAVGGRIEMAEKDVQCSPPTTCVAVGCNLPRTDTVRRADKATQVDLEMDGQVPQTKGAGSGRRTVLDEVDVEEVKEAEEGGAVRREVLGEQQELPREEEANGEQREPVKSSAGAVGAGGPGALKSIMKKRDGSAKVDAGSEKKSLQFVGFLNGEYESTSSEEEGERSPGNSDSGTPESSEASDEEFGTRLECSDSDTEVPVPEAAESGAKPGQDPGEDTKSLEEAAAEVKEKFELSPRMREACLVVRRHLGHNTATPKSKEVLSSTSLVLQEWFRVSSQKASLASEVGDHLLAFAEISPALLGHVVNLADGNGNTALHYSVSHSNFDIVRLLIDTGVCNVNHQNKAGYTALMLAALASVEQEEDMAVVQRLFAMGNVNAKASQAGQTALMLAVSHGRQEMVEALLVCGADINLQDEEGSTALMCACEHGRAGTVRLLLAQPSCNVSTVDNDGNDAVSIALEAGHREIAALISTNLTQSAPEPTDRKKNPTGNKKQ